MSTRAADADTGCIHIVAAATRLDGTGRKTFSLKTDVDLLEEMSREIGTVRLIIIDPISAYMGGADGNGNVETREVLEPLAGRVRCRRVIDAQGRSPSADIYIVLPKDQTSDAILQDILVDMPGIHEVPWTFELDGPAVPKVRKGSSHEALITYMTTRLPGETEMSAVKVELDLTDNTLRKLKGVLGKTDHPTTMALRDIGVRYVVRGKGRGARSFLIKDQGIFRGAQADSGVPLSGLRFTAAQKINAPLRPLKTFFS